MKPTGLRWLLTKFPWRIDAHVVRVYAWILMPIFLLGLFFYGVIWLLPAALIAMPITAVICWVLDRAAGRVSKLYTGGQGSITARDRCTGDLNQARYHLDRKEYDAALSDINGVLERDPSHEEAWYYKARILWVGKADRSGAKRCLIRAMRLDPDKSSSIYRWSANLYKELIPPAIDGNDENGVRR